MSQISDSTRVQYEGRIRKIESKCFKIDVNNITQEQIKSITECFPNIQTCKGAFSALLWYCKGKNAPDTTIEVVQTAFNKLKDDCKKIANSQELTPHQLDNYMTHTELLTLYNQATSKMEFDKPDYNDSWIYYTIVCLYTIQPPVRADYWNMEIIEYNPISDCEEALKDGLRIKYASQTQNYCIICPSNTYFVFNTYKTAKTYGQQIVTAEWIINHLIRHLHFNLKVWKVLPIDSPNALVKYVKKAFSYFGGKEITIGLLRHSYIVEFYKTNPSIAKKQALASKMLHSVAIQEQYRSENVAEDDI